MVDTESQSTLCRSKGIQAGFEGKAPCNHRVNYCINELSLARTLRQLQATIAMNVIDTRQLDQLKELIGGCQDSLNELVETFLVEGDEIIADMKASVSGQDLDLLRRSAHSLKSSAQDFGALELSRLSAALESQCKAQWPTEHNEQIQRISDSFQSAAAALREFLASQ